MTKTKQPAIAKYSNKIEKNIKKKTEKINKDCHIRKLNDDMYLSNILKSLYLAPTASFSDVKRWVFNQIKNL